MEQLATTRPRSVTILGLIGFLILCFAAAGLGGYWTSQGLDPWYASLHKPSWTPPNWLFGPVWTALYTAMAVAAWLVWKDRGFAGAKVPLGLFLFQLALNAAWTGLFFAMKNPGLAFGEVVLFWLAILATLVGCWRLHRAAGALMIPYLIWVSYAGALNLAVWRMNG